MAKVIDVSRGDKKLVEHLSHNVKNVLLVWAHGIGDSIMCLAVLRALRNQFPNIKFDVGVFKGLDIEKIITDAIFIETHGIDWREVFARDDYKDYDLVFSWNFPLERQEDLTKTKAEISCIEELGITPICGHEKIKSKPLVLVHYQQTSVGWCANPTPETAQLIWQDIIDANCVPLECHYTHVFANPQNSKFDFVDNHVRNCTAKMDYLLSLLGAAYAFVGVVSGPFHAALSVMPSHRVMLLEKDLKREHFTKIPIATANLKNYTGEVKKWLLEITRNY